MTPQEKALELVDIFTFTCRECDYEDNAKCALIAVDEILDILNDNDITGYSQDLIYYWQEIKLEIKKL